jgi:hypothetical protein
MKFFCYRIIIDTYTFQRTEMSPARIMTDCFHYRFIKKIYSRSGHTVTVARLLKRCVLDLVGLQQVSWCRGGTKAEEVYTTLCEKVDENHH